MILPSPTMAPPEPLALGDIMLLDDDDDEIEVDGHPKFSEIQEQLQKQAELIRDLRLQRDYLISQILHERERWQAERDGWDRTSEALIARYSRKASSSPKDEELAHRCAVYESDNKSLKEKVHDAQVRLGDLEAELHKLKPLLVIQPTLPPHPQRQESTQSPIPYPYSRLQSYMSPSIHIPPFTSAVPHAAFSPYSASSHDVNQKRKEDGAAPSKGKEKEATTEDVSDANADDDSDNTDAPLTPTPTSSASHNPYAYMNNLYRHVFSPNTVLPATPLKPPGIQNNGSFGNSNSPSAISLNHYTIGYSAYPFSTTTLSKQPPTSTVAGSWSAVGRPDDADKDTIQVDEVHNARQEKAKSTSATTRRTMATSGRQQIKYKTSSMLSDARTEHLLLAARKIGRGRAVTIAGLVKAQERSATEENGKDKTKPKDINRHSDASHGVFASRSTQRRRAARINSPTTPTPRRVHGHTQPLTEVGGLGVTPNASRTRETLFSSGKTPRNRSSVADINASGINASKDDEGATGTGQTPLDSLLSAARTMMSEDRENGPTAAGQNVPSNVGAGASQDVAEHQISLEESQSEVGAHPRKRRRNTISRGMAAATPRSQTFERQGATSLVWQAGPPASSKRASGAKDNIVTPSGKRTRSALDVLADQAAAAFEGGSATHQEADQAENCDGIGASTSDSSPSAVDSHGPVKMSSIHELVPRAEEAINVAAESAIPEQMEVSIETAGEGSTKTGFGAERHAMDFPFQQPCSRSQDARMDKAAVEDRDVTPTEGPAASIAESKPSHSDFRHNSDWDPFGGMPNVATTDSGGDSEGDIDAEGDIDPDSQEMSLDAPHVK